MGVPGARVSTEHALDSAIRDLFAGSGPKLLEDPSSSGPARHESSAGTYRFFTPPAAAKAQHGTILAGSPDAARFRPHKKIHKRQIMAKTFITCAITGASPMPKHPNFPFRPEHVAQEALDAAEAGASIIHVHVRNAEDGTPSQSLDDYRHVS